MSFRPFCWSTGAGVLLSLVVAFGQTVTQVNLTATASPQQGGVPTTVTVLGGNFPAGTISPGSVTVTMTPAAGSGAPAVNLPASGVALVTGTTRRVTFVTPATIGGLVSPVLYQITIAGATTTGLQFRSTGSAAFLALPPAGIASLSPASGSPGERLSITLRGRYTNFIQNGTRVSFGSGITTGGSNLNQAWDSVASLVCRRPRSAPKVNAGNDTNAALGCNPDCNAPSATLRLNGSVTEYSLPVGGRLTPSWQVVTGPGAVTFANPNALSTDVTFSQPGIYRLELAVNDGELTGKSTVQVIVSPYQAFSSTSFTLDPAVSGPNPTGTSVALRARWLDVYSFGIYPRAFLNVEFRVTGANPRTVRAITDDLGYATLVLNGANAGSDQVVARALDSGRDTNTATVQWATPLPLITTGPVTGTFYQADGSGVFNIAKTATPVFTQVFPSVNFNPVSEFKRPFTYVFADGVASVEAAGNGYKAGVRELFHFAGAFTGVLNVPAEGDVTLTVANADGFVLGVGGGATRVSGPLVGAGATTTMQSYPVMAASNARVPGLQTLVVRFPAAGAYPYELDFAKGGDGKLKLVLGDGSGVALGAASSLQISPVNVSSAVGGTTRTFTVRAVAGSGGTVLAGLPVAVRIEGLNAQTRTVTTDGTGVVSFNYLGRQASGVDTVSAAAVVGGVTLGSNVVTVPWNNGANVAPVVSAGPGSTVVFPGFAALQGSASDDGLPSNALTLAWSRVSGPGTVTFDDAGQAVTAAKFSVAGVYVLRLTASDGGLSAFSEVTVTVVADPNWSSGWIANPLDKSSVSEPVPVRLISGITLTSGRLIYRSMTDPLTENVLNAAVSGAGQIGTFDPTGLANGSYFIELRGTNSLGVTQNNSVLVTVVGEYKPGRVNFTTTDLVIPTAGLQIRVERSYDSLDRTRKGDFGYGWSLTTRVNLEQDVANNVTFTLNGRRKTFYFTPPSNALFVYWYTPAYTAEPGLYGRLETTGDNCSGVLARIGNVWRCALNAEGASYQPTGFVYTEPGGRKYTVQANGDLREIKDLNGNTLTIGPNGISSSAGGVNVPLVRDAEGRITRMTDPLGNVFVYGYGPNGDLASVAFPGIATPLRFDYDSGHYITKITDPRGNAAATNTYYPDGKLKSVADALGNLTQLAYDVAARTKTTTQPNGGTQSTTSDAYGLVTRSVDALGRVSQFAYDAARNLVTETSPLGFITTRTYDSRGNGLTMTNPLGITSRVTPNEFGLPTKLVSANGNEISVAYDPRGNPTRVADNLGVLEENEWNAAGLPVRTTDGAGNAIQSNYDSAGNLVRVIDGVGGNWTYAYDLLGRKISDTDPLGNRTQYVLDAVGSLTSTRNALGQTTSFEYDPAGNLVRETDALGRVTSTVYDVMNRVIRINNPDGNFSTATYDSQGNVVETVDEVGRLTRSRYDLANQLIEVTRAVGTPSQATVRFAYDLDGRRTAETDARGNTTTHFYDALGRKTRTTDATNRTMTYAYDSMGNLISQTAPKGTVTRYEYDLRKRPVRAVHPTGMVESRAFLASGKVGTETDPNGVTTRYSYDAAGRLTSATNGADQVTRYSYDLAGNRLSVADAMGRQTLTYFDALNRPVRHRIPFGQEAETTYDALGNAVITRDFSGRQIEMEWDSRNRMISRRLAGVQSSVERYFYDGVGHRIRMEDPSGTTTYQYNGISKVLQKVTPGGALSYTYDLNGNPLTMRSSNANGVRVDYSYDAANRLTTVTDRNLNSATNYSYDDNDNLASAGLDGGLVSSFSVDSNNMRSGVSHANGQSMIQSFAYARSSGFRISSITESGARTVNLSYDSAARLISEVIAKQGVSAQSGTLGYTFDAVGNRLSRTSTLPGLSPVNSTFDSNDRIQQSTFDDNGNQLQNSRGWTLGYDHLDRLVAATRGADVVAYGYSGDSLRVRRRAPDGTETYYLYDEVSPLGLAQVVEEVVGGETVKRYVLGATRISESTKVGGNWRTKIYLQDGLQTVRGLADAGGATATDQYDFDSFGNLISETGTAATDFLYRGEQLDRLTGMYYLRNRWYDPGLGRFSSTDPQSGMLTRPSSLHRYTYAENDPVQFDDPAGLSIGSSIISAWDTLTLPQQIVISALTVCILNQSGVLLHIAALAIDYDVSDVVRVPCGAYAQVRPRNRDRDRDRDRDWPRPLPLDLPRRDPRCEGRVYETLFHRDYESPNRGVPGCQAHHVPQDRLAWEIYDSRPPWPRYSGGPTILLPSYEHTPITSAQNLQRDQFVAYIQAEKRVTSGSDTQRRLLREVVARDIIMVLTVARPNVVYSLPGLLGNIWTVYPR